MRKLISIVFAIGLIFIFQSCATSEKQLPEPEGQLLTQSELEQLYKHACVINYTDKKDRNGIITCFPTGMQIVDWEGADVRGRDTGSFTIEDGQKCDEWDTLPFFEKQCWKFYKIGEKEYRTVSSDGRSYFYTVNID